MDTPISPASHGRPRLDIHHSALRSAIQQQRSLMPAPARIAAGPSWAICPCSQLGKNPEKNVLAPPSGIVGPATCIARQRPCRAACGKTYCAERITVSRIKRARKPHHPVSGLPRVCDCAVSRSGVSPSSNRLRHLTQPRAPSRRTLGRNRVLATYSVPANPCRWVL